MYSSILRWPSPLSLFDRETFENLTSRCEFTALRNMPSQPISAFGEENLGFGQVSAFRPVRLPKRYCDHWHCWQATFIVNKTRINHPNRIFWNFTFQKLNRALLTLLFGVCFYITHLLHFLLQCQHVQPSARALRLPVAKLLTQPNHWTAKVQPRGASDYLPDSIPSEHCQLITRQISSRSKRWTLSQR